MWDTGESRMRLVSCGCVQRQPRLYIGYVPVLSQNKNLVLCSGYAAHISYTIGGWLYAYIGYRKGLGTN